MKDLALESGLDLEEEELFGVGNMIKVKELEQKVEEKNKVLKEKDKILDEKDKIIKQLKKENVDLKNKLRTLE